MIISSDAKATEQWFQQAASSAPVAFASMIRRNGQILLAMIKNNASGHGGGPQVITGRYRDSIRPQDTSLMDGSFSVGTDEPYGYVLEQGAILPHPSGSGTIKVNPHPHFGPAMNEMETMLAKDTDLTLARLFS